MIQTLQQAKTLVVKNMILSWRHKVATCLHILSSLLFLVTLYAVQMANGSTIYQTTAFKTLRNPISYSPSILKCETIPFIELPCFDFLWSGNGSIRLHSIVDAIRANNPGRPIEKTKVLSFRNTEDVDLWLLTHANRCRGALHFREDGDTVISYGIQSATSPTFRGRFDDPTLASQVPLQIAAEKEVSRYLIRDNGFSWEIDVKEFAHPARRQISPLNVVGPIFFLAIMLFGFVMQINAIVTEKEFKLRQAMTMAGLCDSAYWLSWLIWDLILIFASSNATVFIGMLFRFDFFLKISFPVLFFLFFLFQLSMMGFGYMISNFISKSLTATVCGFSIFIISFFTQLVTVSGFPYHHNVSNLMRIIWGMFPPNVLAEVVSILTLSTAAPEDQGMTWHQRNKCFHEFSNCHINIDGAYFLLITSFALWILLAIYLDNVLPNSNGARKTLTYCLHPGYWTGKESFNVEDASICDCMGEMPHIEHATSVDDDVLEEEDFLKKEMEEGLENSDAVVKILGLGKIYPLAKKHSQCFCKRSPPNHAVNNLWLSLMKNQIFCLLGPNGAGKTTLVKCLTGEKSLTCGDALINGHSLRRSGGVSKIRKLIGFCPQFDMLWDELTGEEHIRLFASLKGVSDYSTEKALKNVMLDSVGKMRAGEYSGGMKRRLSIAIALIGDPKLLILDEPSTGTDPITRRIVWEVIKKEKEGRSILLITHSMEEADMLNDRLGIMVNGGLRCLGNSIRLKNKYGGGVVVTLRFASGNSGHSSVKEFFKNGLEVLPMEEKSDYMTFEIEHEKNLLLTAFFRELEEKMGEFEIEDVEMSLATVQEIYLRVVGQVESAMANI